MILQEMSLPDIVAKYSSKKPAKSKSDAINPDHYKVGGIETIEYLQAKLSKEEFAGYCRGNALKYLSRAGHKDDAAQEYRKAIWYIERLISAR